MIRQKLNGIALGFLAQMCKMCLIPTYYLPWYEGSKWDSLSVAVFSDLWKL